MTLAHANVNKGYQGKRGPGKIHEVILVTFLKFRTSVSFFHASSLLLDITNLEYIISCQHWTGRRAIIHPSLCDTFVRKKLPFYHYYRVSTSRKKKTLLEFSLAKSHKPYYNVTILEKFSHN